MILYGLATAAFSKRNFCNYPRIFGEKVSSESGSFSDILLGGVVEYDILCNILFSAPPRLSGNLPRNDASWNFIFFLLR